MDSENIFVNFSNHPSDMWSKEQLEAAKEYGRVVDIPFPAVEGAASTEDVIEQAGPYIEQIVALTPKAVMCQGEFTLAVYVISSLIKRGIPVVAACSERNVINEERDGELKKTVIFRFIKFREYAVV